MKKRLLSLLLAVLMVLSLLPISAMAWIEDSGTCGNSVYWELDSEGVLRIYGSGDIQSDDGYGSTLWAHHRSSIQKVVIEEGITAICDRAFEYLSVMTQVSIPSSVIRIGMCAFSGCESLRSVVIPGNVSVIEAQTFDYCTALSYVSLPDTVQSIGYYAFGGCEALTRICLPQSLKTIDACAFNGSGLTSVELPASVQMLGESAFFYNENMTHVVFRGSAPSIASDVFKRVNATVYYPGNDSSWTTGMMGQYGGTLTWQKTEVVDSGACGANAQWTLYNDGVLRFDGTGELDGSTASFWTYTMEPGQIRTVVIGEGITGIADFGLRGMLFVEELVLCEGLTTIGDSALADYENLQRLVLPSTLVEIKDYGCSGMLALREVVFRSDAPMLGYDVFCGVTADVYYPQEYENYEYWMADYGGQLTWHPIARPVSAGGSCGANLIWTLEGGILTISGSGEMGNYTESTVPWGDYRSSISQVVVKDGVKTISPEAFVGCSNLQEVTLEGDIAFIGENAFRDLKLQVNMYSPYTDCNGICGGYGGTVSWLNLTNQTYVCEHGICGDNLTWVYSFDNEALTIEGTGAMYDEYDNGVDASQMPWSEHMKQIKRVYFPHGLTHIGEYSFFRAENLSSVTIPDTVRTIGEHAFYYTDISRLTIPEGVAQIGDDAFGYCNGLSQLSLPSTLKTIGASAFYGSDGLTELTIPEGVTSLGSSAFAHCDRLEKVTLPSTITEIPSGCFRYNDKLTDVTIPDSVTKIGTYAFEDCGGLTDIQLPKNLTVLEGYVFGDCTALTRLDIPAGVSGLTVTFADNCTALKTVTVSEDSEYLCAVDNVIYKKDMSQLLWALRSITACHIPEGVTTVAADAFSGCQALAEVTLPEGVTTFKKNSFKNCKALTSITFPSTVTTLEADAFYYCTAMGEIIFRGDAPSIDAYAFRGVKATVTYPTENSTWTEDMHQNYGGTLIWNSIVAKGTCGDALTWVLDNNGLLTISGTGAMGNYFTSSMPWYSHRSSITSVVIEEGVTSIGDYAFYGVAATSIHIPASVTTIGKYGLSYCYKLTEFTVAEGSESYSAMDGILCSRDGTVLVAYPGTKLPLTIPETVTAIAPYAFAYNKKISAMVLPEGITEVGEYAFNMSAITSVTMPNSLTKLGEAAFMDCQKLQTVNFGTGLTEIPRYAFYSCYVLPRLSIPEGVTTIGDACVWSCRALTYIELPSTVTQLQDDTFCGCGRYVTDAKVVYVVFRGDAPVMTGTIFETTKAVAYYPAGNSTWTAELLQQYEDIALWVPYTDCAHDFINGPCRFCGSTCPHVWYENRCRMCNDVCSHSWEDGICTVCGMACDHSWEMGVCTTCGYVCPHNWIDGKCTVCAWICGHSWEPEQCAICGKACPHSWSDGVCAVCSKVCQHHYIGNVCGDCEELKDSTVTCSAALTGSFNNWSTKPNMQLFKEDEDTLYASMELEPGIYDFKVIYNGVTYGSTEYYGESGRALQPQSFGTNLEADMDACGIEVPYAGTYELHFDMSSQWTALYYIPDMMYVIGTEDVFGTKVEMKPYSVGYYSAETVLEKGVYNWVITDEHGLVTSNWKDYTVPDLSTVNTSICIYNGWSLTRYELIEAPTIVPKYPTLSFKDEITMNVYFDASGLAKLTTDDMGMITFTTEKTDGTMEDADAVIPGAVKDEATGLYMAKTQSIPANELNRTQYFKIYVRKSDGTYVYSSLLSYSPLSYANSQLNASTTPASMKALVTAMLCYGGAAQRYFGSDTENPADANLTQEQLAYIESYRADMMKPVVRPEEGKLGSFTATETGFSRCYPTISFEGAFAINYYFLPDAGVSGDVTLYYWDAAAYEGAEMFTAENATGVLTMSGSLNSNGVMEYTAAVADIAAKDLDDTIYVAAVYSDGTTEYCSGVLAYSIGAYCVSQAKDGNPMQALAAATAVYGYYAKSYFGEA